MDEFVYTAKIKDSMNFVYPSKTEQKSNFVYTKLAEISPFARKYKIISKTTEIVGGDDHDENNYRCKK